MEILTCLCANSIMPPMLLFSPVAMLYLFIPVILVESLVVWGMLRKPFWQTALVVLVANILSAFAGMALLPVEIFGEVSMHFDSLPAVLGLLLLPVSILAAFALTVHVERRYYQHRWADIPKPLARRTSLVANVLTYVPLLLVMWHLSSLSFDRRMERSYRKNCASNLKQIGLALQQYAHENGGHYPPGEGAKGLELLRCNDYMADMKMYVCASNHVGKSNATTTPLTEDKLDYAYRGGLQAKTKPPVPLAWDKPGNHEDFFNVLYTNGEVKALHELDNTSAPGRQPAGQNSQ